jgi:hypothetical protein
MLVTFSTDAYADITMFGDVAIKLLKMMGHSGTVPSAVMAEDIPAALNSLNAAINAANGAEPDNSTDTDEPGVSMSNRAIPLVNLLQAAAKAKTNVMWK